MSHVYRFLRFPEGKLKAVTFSYDDGAKSDIRFSRILNDHGMKGTFNINSSRVKDGSNNGLTYDDLREHILDKGHEVALHGAFHRASALQRTVDGIRDVLDCRIKLEENLGAIIRGMAYPDSGIRMRQPGTTVWYATNIETHDYIAAYKSLVFSVDERIVYNPTLIKVWFWADHRMYSVALGETLKIS